MTSWTGYLNLGGVELANEERFLTYVENLWPGGPVRKRVLDQVQGLHRAVGDAPYSTPLDDAAPWLDLDDSSTQDFLGLRVTEIIGLDDSTRTADVIESLDRGGTIGVAREGTREIRVSGVLHGLSPEGVRAGLTWLRRTLGQQWAPRPLVPQQPGVSDLRFFVQRPEIPGQIINRVANPTASGLGESLIGTGGTAYAFRVPTAADAWAYRMVARVALNAEVQLQPTERANTVPGQQWVARARIQRDASVIGNRLLRLYLRFRDQHGVILPTVGPDDTMVPSGVLNRWVGARYDSISQQLTTLGMLTNWVINPSAEGQRLGLAAAAGTPAQVATIASTALSGKRSYRVVTNSTSASAAMTAPAPTSPGRQWWCRAKAKQTSALGLRNFRADLEWLDTNGQVIGTSQGPVATLAPTGTTRRWMGAAYNSFSEEVTGANRRVNYALNPTHPSSTNTYGAVGGSTVALERFTGLGQPNVIRVSLPATGTAPTGVSLPMNIPVGETIYVTFWIVGIASIRLQGTGFTDAATGAIDPNVGIPVTTGSTELPVRVSVPIKITSTNQSLRVIRDPQSTSTSFRLARIGLLTGSDSYFDGDTGTYRWEGTPYRSSSIANLPGNYNLYNTPWNSGFEQDIFQWGGDTGTTATWLPSQRMQVRIDAARANGQGLVKQNQWPYFASGQRWTAGMKVYNTSATAVAVGIRVTASTGVVMNDAPTVTVPANGSAWVAAPATKFPPGTAGAELALVARGTIAAGTVLQVDNVFFGTIPDLTTATEAQWFDGSSPSTTGAAFSDDTFDLQAGGVAPAGAVAVRARFARLNVGATTAQDAFLIDQVMLTQADAIDADPTDGVDPVATLPAYFDGDSISTFENIPAFVISSAPGAGAADTTVYDAMVTADAPRGAVTAELAVGRSADGGAVGDVFYVDDVMLADYTDVIPQFTDLTRRDLVMATERRIAEVGQIAGPTIIAEQQFGEGGCNGATAQVEFTLNAQIPVHLRDRGDRVAIPLPSTVSQGTLGSGSFSQLEDASGIVRNYMPDFIPGSTLIPSSWVTTATAGTIGTTGIAPRALRVTADGAARFRTVISALGVLGDLGGYESAVASIWIGGNNPGAQYVVTVEALKGGTVVSTTTANYTLSGAALEPWLGVDSHRVNIPLPASSAKGAANGFRFTISVNGTAGWALIGNPQVTLGSTIQPMIWGGLPDEPGFTYDIDGAGLSYRRPTARTESHTLFPIKSPPPRAIGSLSGYDEVGLTTYRTFVDIDTDVVPRNSVAVPVLRIDFERFVSRWVRFRFYPNPLGVPANLIDTSSYEHEWVIDQLTANVSDLTRAGFMSLVIDGVDRRVWMRAWDGTVIPGDRYVVTSDGATVSWPEFSDVPWVMSVDYPTFRQSGAVPADETWWRASMALMIEE